MQSVLRILRRLALLLGLAYVGICAFFFWVMHQPPPVMARYMDKIPDVGWMTLPLETMWTYVNRGRLNVGDPAPDFDLATVDGAARVKLSSLAGKPVVLFFGSYTCPPFRKRMPKMNELYDAWKDRAQFYFVYIEEAHATDGWPEEANKKDGILYANHRSLAERVKAGEACQSGLKIPFPMLADELDNKVGRAYQAWPIRAYIVNKDGRIAWKSETGPFGFYADKVKPALERILGPEKPPAPAAS
jgi:peroxiredoxin